MSTETAGIDQFVEMFAVHGGTEESYLRDHFPRFVATRDRFLTHWPSESGGCVLDVGAHWLHQALLYASRGFEVTALDLPATLDLPNVQSLARAYGIKLLPNTDLEHPSALHNIANDTFEVVLFTEILEHLAFNPVAMWRDIYRVMKPGARIIVTTPNYHALRTGLRRKLRSMRRLGGGIDVESILSLRTLGHHWKEYSRRELSDYFGMLSPGFRALAKRRTRESRPLRRTSAMNARRFALGSIAISLVRSQDCRALVDLI
jgi:2-polyprenyl-6-hydroxyphenyl methylase/3-demethylubiquinone-9 3-methyltransferase